MNGIVLASASRTRAEMLERAGLRLECDTAMIDEGEVKRSCRAEGMPVEAVAEALALLKATRVGVRHPGRMVIGADQMLECDDEWFDKPMSRQDARRQLLKLRGRTHRLVSATVVVRDGERLKGWTETAELTVRPFSETFLDQYLDSVGDAVMKSVGAYQIEGRGVQLFSKVEGNHFTILGMALLPLLDYLRGQGILTV